jgi:hypothetical protein
VSSSDDCAGFNFENLQSTADHRLYLAKQNGRNQVCFNDLRRALVWEMRFILKNTRVRDRKKERNKPLRHQHSGRVTESSSHFSIIFFMNSSCHAK